MIMYPERLHYEDLLELLQIPSLSNRRIDIVTSFAKSLLSSERHRNMLPPSRRDLLPDRTLRNAHHLHIPKARTTRYKQSPIPNFVKLLNSLYP